MSPATGRPYPLSWVCAIYGVARSSVYRRRQSASIVGVGGKRGPKTPWSDEQVVTAIREVLAESSFLGEGHRKVTARLRHRGITVGKNRVLRLMRQERLLAPVRRGHALEPVRQGVREHFLTYAPKVALGLGLRHDWGPQYTANQFAGELAWLGIRSTPAFVGEPECNGVMERWILTLKEECLYLHDFETLDEAREVIGAFIERYNREWLIERHGHRTPADVRRQLLQAA